MGRHYLSILLPKHEGLSIARFFSLDNQLIIKCYCLSNDVFTTLKDQNSPSITVKKNYDNRMENLYVESGLWITIHSLLLFAKVCNLVQAFG